MTEFPSGVVYLSQWLEDNGLQKTYRKSNWLTPIGTGAMIRSGDDVGYLRAIYALQQHAKTSIHPAEKQHWHCRADPIIWIYYASFLIY